MWLAMKVADLKEKEIEERGEAKSRGIWHVATNGGNKAWLRPRSCASSDCAECASICGGDTDLGGGPSKHVPHVITDILQ